MEDSKPKLTSSYKKKLLHYYLQCLLSESSKVILFTLLFNYFGLLTEFLISLLLLTLLRSYGGGLHFQHYTSCFLMSLTIMVANVSLGIFVFLPNAGNKILLVACLPLAYCLVPITSNSRAAPSLNVIKRSKIITTVLLLSYLVLMCVVPNTRYINIGFWTIVLHIVQLMIAEFLKRRKKTCLVF